MKNVILATTVTTLLALTANAQNNIESHCGTLHALNEFRNPTHHSNRAQTSPPTLTGTEVILNTAHFEIHYTLTGYDSVSHTDVNANSIPDYVDTIAAIAEYVYTTDQARAYMMPPAAAIGASTALYDIYIGFMDSMASSSGVYGVTAPKFDIGDNPASVETELHSTASYLELRNDFNTWTPGVAGSYQLQVTIAHEFSHAIDFSYNLWVSFWLSESRAVFEESVLYPNINDNFQYFPSLLSHPDVALNLDGADNEEQHRNHFYSAWLFHRYVADHIDTNYLKPVLEAARLDSTTSYTRETNRINDNLIYNHETTLKEQFLNFTIANHFLTSDNAYTPYTYGRGNAYRTGYGGGAVVEGNRNFTGAPTVWNSVTWGNSQLMRLSADYIAVTANQNFSVRLNAEGKDTSYGMTVIKIDTVHHTYEFAPAGWYHDTIFAANIRDYAKWNYFLVIVNRFDFYNHDTASKQYEITIDKPLMFLNWWIPNTPFGSVTTTVAVDKNNVLWVGSGLTEFRYDAHDGNGPHVMGGVTSFNGFYWKHYHYYNSKRETNTLQFPDVINDIGISSNNHKWFSDGNSGLFEYNLQQWKVYDNDPTEPSTWGNPHQSFYLAAKMDVENGANPIVAATGFGLFNIIGGNAVQNISVPDLNTTCVRIHGGNTYVGSSSGLSVLGGITYNSTNGLPYDLVTDVEFDHQGNIWAGTGGSGIGVYNGTNWTVYDAFHPSSGYLGNYVHDIAVDDSGTVWVATESGISRFKNGYWHIYNYITTQWAFPSNTVYDIAFDKNGCLFLATDHGVVYFCDTTETATGITEPVANISSLKLFPNPTMNELDIFCDGITAEENQIVNIVNLNGEILKSLTANMKSGLLKIDVSSLANGFYFVEIKNVRAKFVKM